MGWFFGDDSTSEDSIQGSDTIQGSDSIQGTIQDSDSIQGSMENSVPDVDSSMDGVADDGVQGGTLVEVFYFLTDCFKNWIVENPVAVCYCMAFLGLVLLVLLIVCIRLCKASRTSHPPAKRTRQEQTALKGKRRSQAVEADQTKQKLADCEKEKAELEKDLGNTREELAKEKGKDKEIADLKRSKAEKENKLQALESRNREDRAKLQKTHEAELRNLQSKVKDLKQKLEPKDQEISDLKREVIDANANAQRIKTKSIHDPSSTSSSADPKLEAKIAELEKENNKNITTITDLQKEALKYQETIKKKDEDLKENDATIVNLKDDVKWKQGEIDGLEKKIEELQGEKKQLKKSLSDTKLELQEETVEKEKAWGKVKTLELQNEELKDALNKERRKRSEVRAWAQEHLPNTCTIPMSAHEDSRITPVISQFMEEVNAKLPPALEHGLELEPVPGPQIDASHTNPVLLPCIAASRVGSDIEAALKKAKIGKGLVILVIFHPLAYHVCKINTPTEKRLSNRSLLDQCVGMVDVAFYNEAMYDCDINHRAINKVIPLFKWGLQMEDLLDLFNLVKD